MDEQLYLFEVLIDNIYFEEIVGEVPPKKQIVVSVKLGNIVTLEIRAETLPFGGEGVNKRIVDFNSGKSYLCAQHVDYLTQTFEKNPLEITVRIRGDVEPIGSSTTPWDASFKEVVQMSKDPTQFISPATILDNFCLMDNGQIKGSVQMFLRLSCFGRSIQTQFEVLHEGSNKQFLFKTPNMGTTFICSKYGTGTSTDFIPISALYNAENIKNACDKTPATALKSVSWTALMERASTLFGTRSSVQSEFLFPEYLSIIPPVKESAMTFDIVSLRARPEDDRFLDFMTGKKMTDLEQSSAQTMSFLDSDGNERVIFYADDMGVSIGLTGTATKACQCPKTPIMCKHVLDTIKRLEKSQPDLMVFGKRVPYDKILKLRQNSEEEKSGSILRLKGGVNDEAEVPYVHKKCPGCYNSLCPMARKLRSVGISQLASATPKQDGTKDEFFCADSFCPETTRRNVAIQVIFPEDKVPFNFDCPNRYCPAAKMFKKLGLGPLAVEKCQGTLYGPVNIPVQYGLSQTYGTFDTYGPFGIFSKTNTPFLPDDERKEPRDILRLRGGGTSYRLRAGAPSKSPVAECQEVMEQFDKILEEYRTALGSGSQSQSAYKLQQFMDPSLSAGCRHPRCTYIPEPPLPPIHWDCPDPLPVGFCKNPNCPYLPKDLRKIGKVLASRGHTSDDRCQQEPSMLNTTYHFNSAPELVRSQSQNAPICPFYNPPKVVNIMQICPTTSGESSGCSNPNCPLKNIVSSCSNPDCPFGRGDVSKSCSNPDCPFAKKHALDSCSNPDCPFAKRNTSDSCSNPNCPFAQKHPPEACSNPDCPFRKSITAPCSNPDCPLDQVSEESCHNPDCPFKQVSEESCHNPDCPFKRKVSSGSSCGNPDCPFKTGIVPVDSCDATSECKCDNPNCPAHKDTCSNPECPFNLQDVEICANPQCPYRSQPSAKKKGICGSPHHSVCGDKTCPFHVGEGDDATEAGNTQQVTARGGDGSPQLKKDDGKPHTQVQVGEEVIEEGAIDRTSGDRPEHYDMVPCTLPTCRYMGGKLKCIDCATLTEGRRHFPCPNICPGDVKCPLAMRKYSRTQEMQAQLTRRSLKRERRKFMYHIGDKYPGIHVGHRKCVIASYNVPPKMGWLWNVHMPCLSLKPRRGWRPGALGKTILEAIQAHRRSQNMAPLEEGKRKRKKKYGGVESETEIIHPKPTLQIKRREGIYYITMNPLKDPKTLVTNENPYMECTPMQFKILKSKDNNEYKTCICNDQGVVVEPESSSSDSELDIEFTPPAGIIRPERFVKTKDVIHIDTQYNAQDIGIGKDKTEEKDKDKVKDKLKEKSKEKLKEKGKEKSKEKIKEKVKEKKKGKKGK